MSANIYQKSTGQRLFKPYALFDKQGIKIAVIGLTTDDTAKMGNPEYFTDIEFRVPAPEAKRVVEQLRKDEKPDVIIAATHMGHYGNGEHGSARRATWRWRAACRPGISTRSSAATRRIRCAWPATTVSRWTMCRARRARRIARTALDCRRMSGGKYVGRADRIPQR